MEKKDNKKTGNLADWMKKQKDASDKEDIPKKDDDKPGQDNIPKQEDIPNEEQQTLPEKEQEDKKENAKTWPEGDVKEGEIKEEPITDSNGADKEGSKPALDTGKKEDDDWPKSVFLLPKGIFALFVLIDIAGPVKTARGTPRYLRLERSKALIGRYVKAHIHLDDPDTVVPKHAKVIYEDISVKKEFVIYPIDNSHLTVNGKIASSEGIVLKNGDRVEIGSADLIFFQKDLGEEAL